MNLVLTLSELSDRLKMSPNGDENEKPNRHS